MKTGKISAIILSAGLLASPVWAADTASTPLPAGKPAGARPAALGIPTLPALIIFGSVIIAVVAGAGGFNNSTTTTATSA